MVFGRIKVLTATLRKMEYKERKEIRPTTAHLSVEESLRF